MDTRGNNKQNNNDNLRQAKTALATLCTIVGAPLAPTEKGLLRRGCVCGSLMHLASQRGRVAVAG
eukprot:7727489-Alexandrium_andersonii.AAC.1